VARPRKMWEWRCRRARLEWRSTPLEGQSPMSSRRSVGRCWLVFWRKWIGHGWGCKTYSGVCTRFLPSDRFGDQRMQYARLDFVVAFVCFCCVVRRILEWSPLSPLLQLDLQSFDLALLPLEPLDIAPNPVD
jgi:hypothetical protein